MQTAGLEPATFREESRTLVQRPDTRAKSERRNLLSQLSYVRSSLGDWNRTSGLVDPNHALSLLSYTQMEKVAVPNGQR